MFSESGPPATWRGDEPTLKRVVSAGPIAAWSAASHAERGLMRAPPVIRQKSATPAGLALRTLSSIRRWLVSAFRFVSHWSIATKASSVRDADGPDGTSPLVNHQITWLPWSPY